jgi:hypothetical protein
MRDQAAFCECDEGYVNYNITLCLLPEEAEEQEAAL